MRETIKDHNEMCGFDGYVRQPTKGCYIEWECCNCLAIFVLTYEPSAFYSALKAFYSAYREIDDTPRYTVYRHGPYSQPTSDESVAVKLNDLIFEPVVAVKLEDAIVERFGWGPSMPPSYEVKNCKLENYTFTCEIEISQPNYFSTTILLEPEIKKCICPWDKLYANGCKCGGV